MTNLQILEMFTRAVYAAGTLYMMAIILRWLGPWLDLDLHSRRLSWLRVLTDPFISRIRAVMPRLGPMDFAPLVALLAVWVVRTLAVTILLSLRVADM